LPHAGYRYSGQTAAWGVRQAMGRKWKRVVVLGPSHHFGLPGRVSVPDVTHYATPLGEIPLDREFITRLLKSPAVVCRPEVHQMEHSVQIELPLLQYALGDFALVPIVVGQLDLVNVRQVAEVMRPLVDNDTLLIASSDFTHYGPNYGYVPFRDQVPERLKELARNAFRAISTMQPAALLEHVARTGDTICGRYAIGILLALLDGGHEAHWVRFDTSGRVTGDYRNSVSYLAVAFTSNKRGGGADGAGPYNAVPLTAEDKRRLLRLARRTIEYYMKNRRIPRVEELGVDLTPGMKQICGVFVTLKKKGRLRGCIGEIIPRRELYRAVIAEAVNAAVNDPRFPPVTAREVPDLEIEISVLTPPRRVAGYRDIEIGRHGIILRKGFRQAVFLPQVAPEQGWTLEETLTHLSLKAGLPPDAWKSGAEFYVFEATVFSERDILSRSR
ncbi:MAG TPA: AmmeMemoRadiSam system protein B, partial [Lentisphaerae bacterium]|nr:AmmeMemoRadiSam system protein B [Lentisphaerota bacterium]